MRFERHGASAARQGVARWVATLVAAWPLVAAATVPETSRSSAPPATPTTPAHPAADGVSMSNEARQVVQWVVSTADHGQRPFAVVDKKSARLFVFDAEGRLLGASAALLGQARGDHSVPGVADGDVLRIPLDHRTTPAGRFESEPGRNDKGEAIVWFDYDAALAIHRVRPGRAQATRLQSLASPEPDDNRASLGCVVVTPAFYDQVVRPTLGTRRGVVYVLPDTQPLAAVFGEATGRAAAPGLASLPPSR